MDNLELLTRQQAQVLTPIGFYRYWKSILPGKTRFQAYEITEKLHCAISEDGAPKYNDFFSFDQMARRFEKKQRTSALGVPA